MHKQLLERRGVGRGRGRVSGSLTGFETVAAYADVHTMDGRTRRHGSVTWPLLVLRLKPPVSTPLRPTRRSVAVILSPHIAVFRGRLFADGSKNCLTSFDNLAPRLYGVLFV
ncbi:hypothetical protein J6590_014164 [Homalodisca vitripennis]|nr:hypothetical protein J6590_014164 [Homalodisca vitripennis]